MPVGSRTYRFLGVALVVAAATAVRLWPVGEVLGGTRAHIVGDGDAVYHLWRAQRIAAMWPRVPWTDPGLDYPYGAMVPWPPLFDEAIATAAILTPGRAEPEHVARVAAIFPVALAAATSVVLVLIARELGGGTGILGALIASLLPASVQYGFVGLTDHHVAELFAWSCALFAYVVAMRRRERWLFPAVLLGLVLTIAFWIWPGSALYLLVLALLAGAVYLVEPTGPQLAHGAVRALATGMAIAAALLILTVALFAPAGSLGRMGLAPISGLASVLCGGVMLGASTLLVASRFRRQPSRAARRIAEIAAAGTVATLAVLVVPGVRAGLAHGLTAAGADNGWYRSISEFKVALGSGLLPVREEALQVVSFFGLSLVALPFAFAALWREWRLSPGRRQALLVLAVWCAVFLIAAMARMRFMLYLSAPLGLCCGLWLERLGNGSRWGRLAAIGGAVVIVAPAYAYFDRPALATDPSLAEVATWIASRSVSDAPPLAVLAPWADGHAFRAMGIPVVASPFGTDVSARSLEDEATIFTSTSPEGAEDLLTARGVGFVVVRQPLNEIASVQDFRRPRASSPPVIEASSLLSGRTLEPGPEFSLSMIARLFYGDGMAPRRSGDAALGWARLMREESPPDPSGAPSLSQMKTFAIVPGAILRVSGATPGDRVDVQADIETNVGRRFTWRTHALADSIGRARVRVPYATGENGLCMAHPYQLSSGRRVTIADLTDAQVIAGDEVSISLVDH